MFHESLSGKHAYAEKSLDDQINHSASLINFVLPGSDNYFFGEHIKNVEYNFNVNLGGAENRVYIGYTIIGLLAFSIYKYRNKMRKQVLWLLLTGTFIILSLGPMIKIMGNVSVPLPGFLIRYLPGGTIFQAPARFAVISYLGLGCPNHHGCTRSRGRSSNTALCSGIFEYQG